MNATPRALPPVLQVLGLAGLLIVLGGCSTPPRRSAASRAVKEMIEDLRGKSSEFNGAESGERDPVRVTFAEPGDLATDVAWAISKHTDHLQIVASGEEADKQDELVQEVTDDRYAEPEGRSKWDQVGNRLAPELTIEAVLTEYESGELEVRVEACQFFTGAVEGLGIGSSHGTAERAKSWGVTGAKVLATPFLVVMDIGATSVEHAFKGQEEPGFGSTISRGLLAIVYSPVAIFTSKYPKTRNWFSEDEE